MSILHGLNKTKEQERYESILNKIPNIFQGERNRCKAMFSALWGNVTIDENENIICQRSMEECQKILDLFGNEAYMLFAFHKKWQDFIAAIDPEYQYLVPPYNYEFNDDGTVTLIEQAENSSSSSSSSSK